MIVFDPMWGGNDYIQDTPPYDGLAITFMPSIVNDAMAGAAQLESEESSRSYMQSQFRMVAENMAGSGLILSEEA